MYKAAVIGLGRMGSTYDDEVRQGGSVFLPYAHAPSYAAAPNVKLIAGADPHDEQRTLFGERWGIEPRSLYAHYNDMLANESLDMVSICTSARNRSQIIQDVARSGVRAIWSEKPLALSLAEADAAVAVCRENNVTLAVNTARRWNPFYSQIRAYADAGKLGMLLQVTAYGQCGLSHNGSHLIDTVRYLAGGEVLWVWGEMESDAAAAGDEDLMGNGYLAFDNGVRAYIRGMPTGAAFWEFDVIGSEGRVRGIWNGSDWEYTARIANEEGGPPLPARLPFPWPTRIQGTGISIIQDLVRGIETGAPPRCSGADGLAALEIAVALRESHRQGGARVALPLADRSLRMLSAEIAQDAIPARFRRK
ncbi:MAG: Gfo/Idh/MocA family oxidoreductase [Litorilinea sp.]